MVPLNEVGAVGLTEAEARERGVDVEVVEYDLAQLAGTYVLRETYVGRAKLVLDRSSDVVVGATFVGTGVAELTHSATMAVVGKVPVLWHVVPSYPTASEAWLRRRSARTSSTVQGVSPRTRTIVRTRRRHSRLAWPPGPGRRLRLRVDRRRRTPPPRGRGVRLRRHGDVSIPPSPATAGYSTSPFSRRASTAASTPTASASSCRLTIIPVRNASIFSANALTIAPLSSVGRIPASVRARPMTEAGAGSSATPSTHRPRTVGFANVVDLSVRVSTSSRR